MQGKHGEEKKIACLHSHASSPLLTRCDYSTALYFAGIQPKQLTQPHFTNQPTIWDYNTLLFLQRKKKPKRVCIYGVSGWVHNSVPVHHTKIREDSRQISSPASSRLLRFLWQQTRHPYSNTSSSKDAITPQNRQLHFKLQEGFNPLGILIPQPTQRQDQVWHQ